MLKYIKMLCFQFAKKARAGKRLQCLSSVRGEEFASKKSKRRKDLNMKALVNYNER